MEEEMETGSHQDRKGPRERATRWLLLEGNRLVVAAGIGGAVFAWIAILVRFDVLAVGPASAASTLFASGLASGTLTLVTVALSINQLVLSRVFGSPNQLRDRLDGTRELRQRVEDLAGASVSPNDPAAFLSLVGQALRERARALRAAVDESGWSPPEEVTAYVDGIERYGDAIDARVEEGTNIVDVLAVVIGSEYARNMTATSRLRSAYADRLSAAARAEVEAIDDLIEAIAIARQFFKTIALQQDFARLSRIVASTGLIALVTTVSVALVYRTNGVSIDPALLPLVVSLGVAIVAAPLAAFIAYLLRAATIARHTVSVGPFVPPEERSSE